MERVVPNRGPAVFALSAAMIACSSVFVFFRMASRIGIVKKVMLDDYFIIFAWLLAFGISYSVCDAAHFGLGKHEVDVPPFRRGTLNRLQYTFTALYNPALMTTKTSILVFFLTLSKQQRVFKWTIWATLFVVNGAGLALTLMNIFQCRPMSVTFVDIRPPESRCIDIVTLYLSSAPVNIITDIVILLLPMPVLKAMHLPRKQKWILYVTFGFGIFVAVVDVVRISYLQDAALTKAEDNISRQGQGNAASQERINDFSWYIAYSFMWSVIEVNVGIMIACVPALKPLVSRFVPQLIKDKVHYGTGKGGSNGTMQTADMAAAHRVPSFIEPPQPAHRANGDSPARASSGDMSFEEFLGTPSLGEFQSGLERTDTAMTNTSVLTRADTKTHFDFVNVADSKGIVYMSSGEALRPIAEVTFLFVLWGFAYGLLGGLNTQIQKVARESADQSVGTHCAYYVGYFVAPLTFGRLILKSWGFKACYMIGLMVYGTGTLIFWPAAVLTSFPTFLITNFIIGMGLATLEMSANAFIALCGPAEYAEIRLQVSQAFQACGTVIANVLAKKALFNGVNDARSLIDVQWTYLAISLFTFILAFVYYMIRLPEVRDDELEDAAEQVHDTALPHLRKTHTVWFTLALGAFSQFCYVGGQEAIATSVDSYILAVKPGANSVNYEVIGQALFAVSRFLSALLGFWTTPRMHLAFFFAGTIIFSTLAMNFSDLSAAAMVMCVYFFEGPLFSLIYAMPLRAMGRHTKDSTAILAASISGGSFFPAILHIVADKQHRGTQYSYCVAVAAFSFGAIFPIYANLFPNARLQLDPPKRSAILQERSKSTMSSISRQVTALGKRKTRSDLGTMGEKSENVSHESNVEARDSPNTSEEEQGRSANTTAGIDWDAFEQAPVCSSGLEASTVTKPEASRKEAAEPGTPVIKDFGDVDFGKYGRPSSPGAT